MRDLFVDRILYGWERAQALPAGMRPLALLAAASGEASERELLQLPLGERDRRLLELRARLFGERLVGLALCRHCGEHLEVDLALSDVRVNAPTLENAGCIESSGFVVHVRLPNGSDLAALTASDDIASARRAIFERCVLEASRAGAAFPVRDLPDTVVERVAEWMESADSQANIELTVHCPACGNAAPTLFDIASFLWREVEAKSLRMLRDVHELAHAYGWSETEILSLSAARRQLYLEMLGR